MKNNNFGGIIIYEGADGAPRIQAQMKDETVWLSQKQMAELFDKGRSTITEHIRNVFREGELDEKVVCRDFRRTTEHGAIKGKTQEQSVKYYNLDVIISVYWVMTSGIILPALFPRQKLPVKTRSI